MERIRYVDFLKFISIYCVILGHIIWLELDHQSDCVNQLLYILIYSFHMPLFAFLSGLFLNTEISFLTYFKKKTIQIVLPFCILDNIIYIVPDVFNKIYNQIIGIEKIHYSAILVNAWFALTNWSYWFLRSLFFCFCIAFWGKGKFRYWIWTISAICAILYPLSGFSLPCNNIIHETTYIFPFFILGKIYNDFESRMSDIKKQIAIVAFLAWSVLFIILSFSSIEWNVVTLTLLRFIMRLSAVLFFVLSSTLLYPLVQDHYILTVCEKIGRYTLIVYILELSLRDHFYPLLSMSGFFKYMFELLFAALSLCICYNIGILINKNKLLAFYLMGKEGK